jgi:carbon monoxide dehydrogenase subunit G
MRFEADISIKATPETIWAAVADPETWPNWTDAVHGVKKLSEGPLGVGSKLRITVMFLIPVRLYMTITELVPGQRVAMEGRALFAKMTRYYVLRPQKERTEAIVGGEASGPLAPLTWLIGQVLSDEIVQALKIKIEG